MFDYLATQGRYAFSESPVTPVDMLILSMLAYCPLENVDSASIPAPLAYLTPQIYPEVLEPEEEMKRQRFRLWHKAAASKRFHPVQLQYFESHFDSAMERQFAAALFQLDPFTAVVAFRGTDSTVTGWKEDFNMAFESPVPAQIDATAFLMNAASRYPRLYVCGHSKGGNLAVYAASHLPNDFRHRVVEVYSFDGPGVDDDTFTSPEYAAVADRIRSYVPEASVIGMLLNYHEDYTVIDSDGISISQHNPFLWHIEDGEFVIRDKLTAAGIYADRTIHDFLARLTKPERKVVVETLFKIIAATKAHTLKEIPGGLLLHFPAVLSAIRAVPEKNRFILLKVAKALIRAGGNNLNLLLGMDDIGRVEDEDELPM